MAKCPKCNRRLRFFDTISLSTFSNKLLCRSCGTVLDVNKSAIRSFGLLSVSLTLFLLRHGDRWFGNQNFTIGLGLATLGFFGSASLFYYQLSPTISRDQDKSPFIPRKAKKRPPLPENCTRIDYLKNRFHFKSNHELEKIAIDPKRLPEAHQAAKELLEERTK